jgi:hypothetical protein
VNPPTCISADFYEQRARHHERLRDRLARRSLHMSNLRGLTFVVFAVAGGLTLFGHAGALGVAVSAAGLAAFVFLVVRHAHVINAQELEERWISVNRDAAQRVTPGAWHHLPQTGESFRDPSHAFSDDLDIFGKGSLFQRICVAQTHMGQQRLFEWLSGVAETSDLEKRQMTLQRLAPELDLRQELEVLGLGTRGPSRKGQPLREPGDLEPLLAWAEGHAPPVLGKYLALAWLMPALTVLGVYCSYRVALPISVALAPLVLNLWLLVRARRHMASLMRMLSTAEGMVDKAGALFALLEGKSDLLGLDERLRQSARLPSMSLSALSRVGSWFELRHNGLIYPFANVLLLWDIHCWLAFERWRRGFGGNLRDWFAAIGDVEALSSLAGLYHDEPGSCFAEITAEAGCFEATALGHVLIHPAERVANDVSGLHAGHGLLVTGSNMSGKSTYLRAIGIGAVLGLAGGPVCASRLRIGRLRVATSMRVHDDLASGVSHFYAELQKLKRVLDASRGPSPVLFLLDEILHGTNSGERQIGARYILAELLRAGAFGAVSTHDSALCELTGELAERLQLVHFRESLRNGEMTFDYHLHPGPVTAGNALRLMQKLGIEVPIAG